jgi:hypothetical protein
LQQQCFRLIVCMVSQRNAVAFLVEKSSVAQFACGGLYAMIGSQGGDIDLLDVQRNIQTRAVSSAETRPVISIRADSMMHMQGGQPPFEARCQSVQQMQQHDRIHAAAQTDEDVTMPGKMRRESRRNGIS